MIARYWQNGYILFIMLGLGSGIRGLGEKGDGSVAWTMDKRSRA